jgi:hypothetical protein
MLGLSALLPVTVSADETILLDDVAFPARWQPDPWSKAPGTASLTDDAPDTAVGEASLRVTIDWPADDEFRFCSVMPRAGRGPVPYRVKEVSVWAKAAGDPHYLEVHFKDAKGGDAKIGFGPLAFAGWQRLTKPVPAEWEQPLTLTSITWHNWGLKGAGGSATTLLARLEGLVDETHRLVPGKDRPEVLLGSESPYGIADDGGRCAVALRFLSWSKAPRRLAIEGDLLDENDRPVAHDRPQVDLVGEQSLRLPHDLPRFGCFRYALRVSQATDSAPFAQAETHLVRLPVVPQSLTDEERMRSSIGVNTHLGAPWLAFERMGIHWARDYSWGWLRHGETAPIGQGRDFAALAAEAARHHVIILPVTQAAFRNEPQTGFLEDSAAIRAGFERLSRAFPQLPYWEIDNEYEYALRDKGFDLADYQRALRAASEGLRAADAAKLVLNGTAGIRYDLAAELLNSDARDAFAVVNSHLYTGTAPPELGASDVNVGGDQEQAPLTPLDQLRRISSLAHEAGKESWLTEIGWDVTNGPAVGEKRQALYLPRVYLLARWAGVDKVFWFYDRDVPGSTIRFSTCGLMRLDDSLRPSAVAMAALSQETARAAIAGSLDLGDDLWAIVLRRPGGDWTIAAWSVLKDHPLPRELAGAEATDVFGNPCQPDRLTPAITYFHLPRLPEAWDLQRQASWESSPLLVTCPGGTVQAAVAAPAASLRWAPLPEGVRSAGWRARDNGYSDTLTVEASVAPGRHPLGLTASGDGWRRTWRVTLLVEPVLEVTGCATYEPNQAEVCTVRSPRLSGRVTARFLNEDGTIAPASFAAEPGTRQRLAIVPSAKASGVLRVEFAMESGARQEMALYPLRAALPRVADEAIDGDLAHWPAASLLPCASRAARDVGAESAGADGPIRVRLAWAPAGLLFSVEMPAAFLTPGKPDSFWDFTNVELFIDPESGSNGWSASCRQFWFTPVKEGDRWRLAAGQWLRIAGQGSVTEERCRTTIAEGKDTIVFEGLVPGEALAQAPAAGESWRCGVSVRGVSAERAIEAGWPRTKTDGLLTGPGGWGVVTFG